MTRKTLTFAILLLLPFTTHAQHFDWVRSYYGPDFLDGAVANEIFGSEMDSEGNVYILGQFFRGARWDNESPILSTSEGRKRGVTIAKFSPEGNLVWHKELYSTYDDIDAYTIKMVGDSALILSATFYFPFDHGYGEWNDLYYFGAFAPRQRFPQAPDSLESPNVYNAFITLGLEDGDVIEEHFWIPTMVKSDGSLLRNNGYLIANFHQRDYFTVDHEGNIIFVRKTNDFIVELCDTCPEGYFYWSPLRGNISGLRILVDGATKQLDIPLEPSSPWNYQIIKFSPHLDSVISSTYVLDSTWRYNYNAQVRTYVNAIDIDVNDNIYLSLARSQYPFDKLPIKNSDSLAMEWFSCMIRFNSELMPTGLAQVTADYSPDVFAAGALEIVGTYYDTASHSLFLRGVSKRHPEYTTLKYRDDTLNLINNACWLRLDADDLSLISYGKARSTANQPYEMTFLRGDSYWWAHFGSFVASGNRVFSQVNYQSNILFHDTQINRAWGMGLFIWDYEGHELAYIDYNSNGKYNEQGYIHLKDSMLWITGTLTANADFSNIHVDVGNSRAYIARYTDTAFMTPYVYDSTGGVRITRVEDGNSVVAYPNPFRQRVVIEIKNEELRMKDGIATAILTDMMGRREEMRLTPEGSGRYALNLAAHPQAIYMLTLVTADGKQHMVKLLKQP